MNIDDYAYAASRTAIFPKIRGLSYLSLGLAGEVGELLNVVKKIERGDFATADVKHILKDELGDVLWYVIMLAVELDLKPSDVAQANLDKLWKRQQRNTIQGHNRDTTEEGF